MSRKVLFILFFLLTISCKGQSKEAAICLNMIVKNEKDVIEKCLNDAKVLEEATAKDPNNSRFNEALV
ncbi:MAG: hypothetical protein COT84_01605 [Chlamydiae bacterium CG10_big_fil_rev_8_21_14_0_10_35_9]|nr:MAG: hypothetical protein COT84_01605 [Chlamydiae bacterium CG10_big_fil_rev_8_21_14_0_10_35_9]